MTQTAAFASSAFLLGYYTLKSSEAATIENSKRITVSESVNLKTGAQAHTGNFKGHIHFTHCFEFFNNNKI